MNLDVVLASNFLDDFLEPDESLDPQAAFRGSFSSILTLLNASAELLFGGRISSGQVWFAAVYKGRQSAA